ncbi:MAG: kelch repeat-containing protein [Cytophagales bacterium]|nr:kelch repeat-containing protein [Cytophagales bacterium]
MADRVIFDRVRQYGSIVNPLLVWVAFFVCQETVGQVRNAHSLVYHEGESMVYLFGGATEKEVIADLQRLNGHQWEDVITAEVPPARTFAGLVYDPQNDRLVLFGGSKVLFGKETSLDNLLNDTWQFKDGAWRQLFPESQPSPRAEMSMAYDVQRQRLVLFAGYTIEGKKYIKLSDTWEYYEDNWHRVKAKGPTARHGAPMVYEPSRKQLLLFGGSTIDRQYGPGTGETWVWNNNRWEKLTIEQPIGVFNAAMAYDSVSSRIIRFGGYNGDSRVNSTLLFSGNAWEPYESNQNPLPRNHHAMVYDARESRVLMYGGHDGKKVFGDLWAFQIGEWQMLYDVAPKKRVRNSH